EMPMSMGRPLLLMGATLLVSSFRAFAMLFSRTHEEERSIREYHVHGVLIDQAPMIISNGGHSHGLSGSGHLRLVLGHGIQIVHTGQPAMMYGTYQGFDSSWPR